MQILDILDKLAPAFRSGDLKIRASDGKIVTEGEYLAIDYPWIHMGKSNDRDCLMFKDVIFTHLKVVPLRCYECWKVVITPKTFKELLFLYETLSQKVMAERPCKCGVEVREHVSRIYGGYIYCESKEQGLEWKKKIGELCPNMPVRLKRACTEFEMALGPSDEWVPPSWQNGFEESLWQVYEKNPLYDEANQPGYLKIHYILNWMKWAHGHGDMTYLESNGGNPLYPETLAYE
jgi:hypothetical protein